MLRPGDRFDRYEIRELVGEGGMGRVYRAEDPKLGRPVALKVISERVGAETGDAKLRLLREARAAAALDHPNAVIVYDVGEHEGRPFIVMELVEGRPLRALVGAKGVSVEARLRALADAGKALGAAHQRGLVHRDVKPENVMVRTDGRVKVLDFGIARLASGAVDPSGPTITPALPTLTMDGLKLGTPVYMAPEQIRGDALDGRADQFSWAVVAYELLAGRLPWRGGDALGAMASILTDSIDRAPLDAAGVPPAAQAVLVRALSKRPEERYPSMDDAVSALERAARGEAPEPEPPAGLTEQQTFDTRAIREVLAGAVDRQAEGGSKLRFEELLAVAEEVGVDAENVRAASRAFRERSAQPPAQPPAQAPRAELDALAAERDAWLRRKRRAFDRHAGVYAIVNGGLLVLGLLLLPATPWWIWFIPAVAWGVGLAIHGLVARTASADDFAEERATRQWWQDRQRERHEERMARATGKGRTAEAATPRPAGKLRVELGSAAAEAEAAALEEEASAKARQRR